VSGQLSVGLVGLLAGSPAAGVPRYTVALTRALDGVAPDFPELSISLITTDAGQRAVEARNIATHVPHLARPLRRGPLRLAAEQLLVPFRRTDLLHFFDLSGPVLSPFRPFTATIHDASVVRGQEFTPARRAYKQRLQPWAAGRARALVAVSAFAKDEAVELLGAQPGSVSVIHSGPGLLNAENGARATADEPYLLYVGGLAANKNLPFLVRAFAESRVGARLKLVGRAAPGTEETLEAIRSSSARDRIEIVSDASDLELDHLYRGAIALLHPSRYEGFGFTPLEAMSRGCPVLASDIPSLREVSGEGAMILPLAEPAWTDGIRRVCADGALRGDLRRRGAETVARYSWAKTARSLCELLLAVGRGES
jgi:glycosyltransferase involved in cell wall biosynthesis